MLLLLEDTNNACKLLPTYTMDTLQLYTYNTPYKVAQAFVQHVVSIECLLYIVARKRPFRPFAVLFGWC